MIPHFTASNNLPYGTQTKSTYKTPIILTYKPKDNQKKKIDKKKEGQHENNDIQLIRDRQTHE